MDPMGLEDSESLRLQNSDLQIQLQPGPFITEDVWVPKTAQRNAPTNSISKYGKYNYGKWSTRLVRKFPCFVNCQEYKHLVQRRYYWQRGVYPELII